MSVEDVGGNVVSSAASITLAIASQPGAGAVLACSGTGTNGDSLAAINGVADFTGCKITGKIGSYTLNATAGGFTTITSNAFTITFGAASQVVFSAQPGGGANGTAWTNQPKVTVEDQSGNVVTNSAAADHSRHRDQSRHRGHPRLLGHRHQRRHLCCRQRRGHLHRLQDHRQGRQLHAERGRHRVTAVTSNGFSITFGAASQLVFSTQPGGGVDGTAWTNQPSVSVEDQSGNVVTSSAAAITLAIATQPGTGATLACSGTGTNGEASPPSPAWPPSPAARSPARSAATR